MAERSRVRDSIDHPIIDIDGHVVEFMPVFEDYLREFAGPKAVDRYRSERAWYVSDPEVRRTHHMAKPPWGYPVRADDHLAAMLPALLEERLGELGVDFVVMYPSPKRLGVPHDHDPETRQPICRAFNTYMSDLFRAHSAHLTPAAVIPLHEPSEAIEELEHAVNVLGMKTTMLPAYALRPKKESLGAESAMWWDNFVIDSAYDYDPVWQKFADLGVVPAFHSGTIGIGSRISSANSLYNFFGHFPAAQESICKALVLGGVTRRFPALKFAFLTAGVAWAVLLLAELADQWNFRNVDALRAHDPANFDEARAAELFAAYAPPRFQEKIGEIDAIKRRMTWPIVNDIEAEGDEFADAGVTRPEDLIERFSKNLYFGCEGRDDLTAMAFDRSLNPFGGTLKAAFGSDLGHYTPVPMSEILGDAHRLVEESKISTGDFRALMFSNAVEMFGSMNPSFFAGTAIEKEAAAELGR